MCLSYLFLHVCPFLLKGRQRKPISIVTELLQTTSTRIFSLKLRCQDGSQSSTLHFIALNHSSVEHSRATSIRGKHTHTHQTSTDKTSGNKAVTTGPSQGPRSTSASAFRSAGPFFISFCQGDDGLHHPFGEATRSEKTVPAMFEGYIHFRVLWQIIRLAGTEFPIAIIFSKGYQNHHL